MVGKKIKLVGPAFVRGAVNGSFQRIHATGRWSAFVDRTPCRAQEGTGVDQGHFHHQGGETGVCTPNGSDVFFQKMIGADTQMIFQEDNVIRVEEHVDIPAAGKPAGNIGMAGKGKGVFP
jgi:hypothetical protein